MIKSSINIKIMLGYVAMLIVTLAIGSSMYIKSSAISMKNQTFVENTLPLLRLTEEASGLLNNLHMAAFAYYGTTITSEQFDTRYTANKKRLDANLDAIKAVLGDKHAKRLKASEKVALNQLSTLKSSMTNKPINWDAARENLRSIQEAMESAQSIILEFKTQVEKQANQDAKIIQQEIEQMHLYILIAALVILMIIAFAYWIAKSQIVKPLISLSDQLSLSAQEMDLTKSFSVHTSDELADMSTALNKLISAFRKGTQSTRDSAGKLLISSQEMDNVAQNAKSQINTFSTNIQNLTSQISTFENNILEAASRSRSASETAMTGASQVEIGAKNVDHTAQSITRLTQDLEVSSETLLALKASGDQVSAVVSTIAAIAEQTNLLALNAAIEAARAGESGRGFAVVADEVRLLATRTHESTHQINLILETIINAITQSVESMNSNKNKASQTVDLVNHTVNSLKEIQQTILQLSNENHDLASLAEQNEQVIANMRGQIQDVSAANETLSHEGNEISASSSKLSSLAKTLNSVANLFKS